VSTHRLLRLRRRRAQLAPEDSVAGGGLGCPGTAEVGLDVLVIVVAVVEGVVVDLADHVLGWQLVRVLGLL
jgi:hypothetical protein